MSALRVGATLYGFCGGFFGRDSYEDKRIEALGADWLVARGINSGEVHVMTNDDVDRLTEYLERQEEQW